MTDERHRYSRLTPWATAFALLLAADVLAQAPAPRPTVAYPDDMRLWSFGDCERRFPYFDTDEHKQCVRTVGSPEARDARALHVCEVSHATDHTESERCKATYQSNKEKALRDGWASNPQAQQDVASPEVMRRVKAITSAANEDSQPVVRAAPPAPVAQQPAPPAVDTQNESSWASKAGVVFLVIAVVGFGASVVRRKQAQSA